MKRSLILMSMMWLVMSANSQSQLCLSTNKTTSLVFPFAVKHVDRGSRAVLAQQVKEVPTILLVKAATSDLGETNLSVVTEDGSLYTFSVCYELNPATWVHYLPLNHQATTAMRANGILDNPPTIHGIKSKKLQTEAALTGIYVKGEVMYYQLQIKNPTPIDYDIDLIRFYLRDKKQGRRTAVQEIELKPLYTAGNTTKVKAHSSATMVFALEKLSVPKDKYLELQINE